MTLEKYVSPRLISKFFINQLPRIVDSLERIASALEKQITMREEDLKRKEILDETTKL